MKVLLGTIALIFCAIYLTLPTLAIPSTPPKDKLQYNTKTWELDYDPETYSTFITSLRSALSVETACKIPVTSISPKPKDAFILVDIINTSGKTITLAFRTSNVYFVGFKDKLNGAYRANFVKDDFKELEKSDLFSDAKIRTELPHGGGYDDLTRVAKLHSRQDLALGVTSFSSFIDTVYGSDYNGKVKPKDIGIKLAKFALMSIQMISEAIRFKYIEGKVKDLGMHDSFKPDNTFIALENSWDPFSKLIHNSSPGCKPVKSPDFSWDDIKPQVGLLKYKNKGLGVPFMEGIFGNNDDGEFGDDDVLGFIM